MGKAANNPISVYSGQQCVGYLIRRGKIGVEAFSPGDQSLGVFKEQRDAIRAVVKSREAQQLAGPPEMSSGSSRRQPTEQARGRIPAGRSTREKTGGRRDAPKVRRARKTP
jgi:hypothetical protein